MSAAGVERNPAEQHLPWFSPTPARKVKLQVSTNTLLDPNENTHRIYA
jgi:hypothetical protein